MEMCVLHPPNSQHFSDDVITGVVQRSRSSRNSFVEVDNSFSPDAEYHQAQHSHAHTRDGMSYPTRKHDEAGTSSLNAPPGRWQATSDNTTDLTLTAQKRKRGHLQSSVSMSPPTSEKSVPVKQDDQIAVMARLIISEQQRIRELRRIRQIRYRSKKDKYALSLEEENRRLRIEIEKLSQQRLAADVAASANESVWSVAVKYFRLFQFGIPRPTSTLQADEGTQSRVYDRFLKTTMAPDVAFNSESGQEAILKSWSSLSLWFKDIELELEGLDKAGVDAVIATTTTSATITQKTLQCVFPQLRADETTGCRVTARARLADKLLGRRVVMRGSTRFYWDGDSGRVARVMSQSDMLTPMLRLLGNLEDVAVVFEGALITLNFQWNP